MVLPALAAAAIPLILHLLNKRRTKTVLFSSLRFLKLLENKRIRNLRLYQLLLILLRTLFILFLVLAFARPTLQRTLLPNRTAQTTAVIILDDSYSMQRSTSSFSAFNQARKYLKVILSTFSEKDNVFLLPASGIIENPHPLNLNDRHFLNRLKPTENSPDFSPAINSARSLFARYPNFNKELYLVSDFRINQKKLPDSLFIHFAPSVHLFRMQVLNKLPFLNLGIDSVFTRRRVPEQGRPLSIFATIRNDAETSMETRVHLFSKQKRLAMQAVTLPPRGSSTVKLVFVPERSGLQDLRVELDNDELTTDNYYYLNLNIAGKLRVLLLGKPLSAPLSAAVQTLNEQSLLHIQPEPYRFFENGKLSETDLIVLHNPPPLRTETLFRLRRFATKGHSLFLIPGNNTTRETLNALLNGLNIKASVQPLRGTADSASYFALPDKGINQQFFSALLHSVKKTVSQPHIFKYFPMRPIGKPLLKLSNGDPFVTSYKIKESASKLFLMTTAPQSAWNNLPLKGMFLPLLHHLFYLAGAPETGTLSGTVDQNLEISLPGRSVQDALTLLGPLGKRIPLSPHQAMAGVTLLFQAPLDPGNYQILFHKRTVSGFSVNPSSAELHRPYLQIKKFKGTASSLNPETISADIQKSRSGQELWYLFLSIAFLMLVLEIIVVKRIEGKIV